MRYPFALLAAVAALLVPAAPAVAKTIHVDVTNDELDSSCAPGDCSLREAVTYAPVGATIVVPSGTYSLTMGELVVLRTMTIVGASRASTTITGGNAHRTIHDNAGPVTWRNVTITGGSVADMGAGLLDTSTEQLTLDNVRVTNNTVQGSPSAVAQGGGGGVYADGPVTLNRSSIDTNGAFFNADGSINTTGGGGVYVNSGSLTAIDSQIAANDTSETGARTIDESVDLNGGGGAYVNGGSLTLTRSTVAANFATVNGQTDISDNGGGGIWSSGTITAQNSTVSDNTVHVPASLVDNGGGGIFVSGATATLTSLTIAGNSATSFDTHMDSGGALYHDGGTVKAKDTIFAKNTADTDANCFGAVASQGHNIEDKNTCGLHGTGDKRSTPIALGPLKSNGGPTSTRAIFVGGPAFNAGAGCPRTDQRGVVRSQPRCDVGAFEIALPVVVTGGTRKVHTTSARLVGTVFANGRATTYSFQFGRTRAYGARTAVKPAGAGFAARAASGTAKGLKPATIYHYRLVAKNALGTARGRDRTFITHMKLPSRCVSGRQLTVPVGRPKGTKVAKATALVNGKRFLSRSGSDVRRLTLTGLPGKAFGLKVVARLGSGRMVLGSHRYKPCK